MGAARSLSPLKNRGLLGLAVVLFGSQLLAQQTRVVIPARPEPPTDTRSGTAAITGVIFDATTGGPIAGAIVVLEERVPGSPKRSYVQMTTAKGRFGFVDLPASSMYFLTTTKPGFLDGGYGRSDPRGSGAPIALVEGQWLRDVRLTMAHPASISGTVIDERGEPVVGVHVRVLPQILVSGRTQWLAGAVAQTDDRGAYRIPGLGPGKYVVSVPSVQATVPIGTTIQAPGASAGTSMADLRMADEGARAEKALVDVGVGQQMIVGRYAVSPPPTPDGHRTAYPIAFYPNVASPAEATALDLGVGEDRSAVDFQLRPVRTARVSGVVVGPPDAIGNLLLRLIPIGLEELGQGSEAATTVTSADGRFAFVDVPNGSYVIDVRHTRVELTYTSATSVPTALPAPVPFPARVASARGVAAAPPGVELSALSDGANVSYWARQRVEVSDRDIGVEIILRRPASMSGQIVWAQGTKPESMMPMLEPADGRRSLGLLLSPPKGRELPTTFLFEGLLDGQYLLRVGLSNAAVESITWNGRDYTERAFDASAGQDITNVVLTLTTGSSSVAGIVSDGVGPMATGAAVIAFPVEREGWSNYGFTPTRMKSVLTTGDGHFRIDGLPAGEYYFVGVPASQERAWLDPSLLAGFAARASRVRIDRSDAKVANLSLSLVR